MFFQYPSTRNSEPGRGACVTARSRWSRAGGLDIRERRNVESVLRSSAGGAGETGGLSTCSHHKLQVPTGRQAHEQLRRSEHIGPNARGKPLAQLMENAVARSPANVDELRNRPASLQVGRQRVRIRALPELERVFGGIAGAGETCCCSRRSRWIPYPTDPSPQPSVRSAVSRERRVTPSAVRGTSPPTGSRVSNSPNAPPVRPGRSTGRP